MTEEELNFFKESLLKMREDLVEQIEDASEDTLMKSQKDVSGDISDYSLHMADVATDNYDRDFNLNLVSNERKLLFEIDEAIKRIENKTYGICLSCNKYISKSRLKAIPYARYCTKCKRKLEQENRI
jgi:DnaK suppressor protein